MNQSDETKFLIEKIICLLFTLKHVNITMTSVMVKLILSIFSIVCFTSVCIPTKLPLNDIFSRLVDSGRDPQYYMSVIDYDVSVCILFSQLPSLNDTALILGTRKLTPRLAN